MVVVRRWGKVRRREGDDVASACTTRAATRRSQPSADEAEGCGWSEYDVAGERVRLCAGAARVAAAIDEPSSERRRAVCCVCGMGCVA